MKKPCNAVKVVGTLGAGEPAYPGTAAIETTLYDVIEAVREETRPGEEYLVTAAVIHLLNSGRVIFTRKRKRSGILHACDL